MAWNDKEAQRLFDELSTKAMTDRALRARLLKDPKPVIEEAAGKKIADDFKIKIVEADAAYDMTFVLPAMASELSDSDLEKVAGGDQGGCGAMK